MEKKQQGSKSFTKLYDAVMIREDLTLHQSILLCDILRSHEGGLKYYKSFATIGRLLKASHNTVGKAVKGLVDKGEIRRDRIFKEKREVGSYYTYIRNAPLVVYNLDNGHNSKEMYGVSNLEDGVSNVEEPVSNLEDGVSNVDGKETTDETTQETTQYSKTTLEDERVAKKLEEDKVKWNALSPAVQRMHEQHNPHNTN